MNPEQPALISYPPGIHNTNFVTYNIGCGRKHHIGSDSCTNEHVNLFRLSTCFFEQSFNGNFNEEEIEKVLSSPKKVNIIDISRNISKSNYFCSWNCNNVLNTEEVINEFCRDIVSRLPYILYNDDFADRPPSRVEIPVEKPKTLTGWLAIYERLFLLTNQNYSLFSLIKEQDQRRKESILSDVEAKLNSTISSAWKSFSSDKNSVLSIALRIDDSKDKALNIRVVEIKEGKNRYFDVLDRSKGFIWHFNFIMKTQFNPKVVGNIKDTVFLLDEPGSYLHAIAQEKLCSKLKEISKEYGIVIYCTHSHHLLNPKVIPIKDVKIIEKNSKKSISSIPLPLYKTRSEKNNAMQPIYEALQIPVYEFFNDDSVLLLVEGINDKNIIEMILKIPDTYKIFPGVSADSILKDIPYMIAYNKKFVALWDNDEEGRNCLKKAEKQYGLSEEALKILPLEGKTKRRMEDMINLEDLKMIAQELKMPQESRYEVLIPSLYYQKNIERERIIKKISQETQKSFEILGKILFLKPTA